LFGRATLFADLNTRAYKSFLKFEFFVSLA
jgi:hypothetical protein